MADRIEKRVPLRARFEGNSAGWAHQVELVRKYLASGQRV